MTICLEQSNINFEVINNIKANVYFRKYSRLINN